MEKRMLNKKHIGLATLALSAILSLPSYAQTAAAVPPASPPCQGSGPGFFGDGRGPGPGMGFRADFDKIQKEQEDLDIARDKLLDTCIAAAKDKVASCTKERDDLKARAAKLRDDKKALHDKMDAFRQKRMEMRQQGLDQKTAPAAPAKP